MKIKTDFVSNSSSASFILLIDSTTDNFDLFVESWEHFIEDFINEHSYRIDQKVEKYKKAHEEHKKWYLERKEKISKGEASDSDKTLFDLFDKMQIQDRTKEEIQRIVIGNYGVEQVVGTAFQVLHWTSMFNYLLEDVPEWMKYAIIMENMYPGHLMKYGFKTARIKIEKDN